jgi:hypothetical protein
MDVRTILNKNPRVTLAIASVVIVLVCLLSLMRASHIGRTTIATPAAFYTDDDGQTLFSGAPGLVTPFDHNGKSAVKAVVYTVDRGRHQWVQFLQKFTDESAKHLNAIAANGGRMPTPEQIAAGPAMPTLLVKKPGDGDWIPMSDAKAQQLMQPAIPSGMSGSQIELVLP